MAQNVRLTVTIPTYNRPEHIQRQVRDVLSQMRDGVSLVVYDNCSDIPVKTYFSEDELSKFTLYRNPINVGGAANIGKCLAENGNGWIWLLGDDDRIAPNAIDLILETINNNADCCYINFLNKKTKKTKNFKDFLDYYKIIGTFGTSFFQSACLFNMDKLYPYVRYYYEFLSSWVGQIVMVIKYLEENSAESCYFTKSQIVYFDSPGDWSKKTFLISFPIVIDKLHYQKKLMKSNLFKALGDMYFTILSQEKLTFGEHLYFLRYIIAKLGVFNIIRYNTITMCEYLLKVLLPKPLYVAIRNKIARNYNKSK